MARTKKDNGTQAFVAPPSRYSVKIEQWKGKPIFQIHDSQDRFAGTDFYKPWISFGIEKAKAILNHSEEIKNFVAQYDKQGQ